MKPSSTFTVTLLSLSTVFLFSASSFASEPLPMSDIAVPAVDVAPMMEQCSCSGMKEVYLGDVMRDGMGSQDMESCRTLVMVAGYRVNDAVLNYFIAFKNFPQDLRTMKCIYVSPHSIKKDVPVGQCASHSYSKGNRKKNPYIWEPDLSMERDVSCVVVP